MFVVFRSVPILAALVVAGAFAAGCQEETGPGSGKAKILAQFPDGNSVEADGDKELRVILIGTNADGDPDTSNMTVKVDSDAAVVLTSETTGNYDPVEKTLAGTPDSEGTFAFNFQCPKQFEGRVRLQATNGNASTTFNLTCVGVQGELKLTADTAQCATLQATGSTNCRVSARVFLDASDVDLPQADTPVSVTVTAAENARAPDGSTTGNKSVLSVSGEAGALRDSVTVTTDVDGNTSFFVHSPVIFLEEEVVIKLSSVVGDETLEREVRVRIGAFENSSDLTLTVPQDRTDTVIGNDPLPLLVSASRIDGSPAANETVTVRVTTEGAGAGVRLAAGDTPAPSVTLTLGDDGRGTVQFVGPALTRGQETLTIPVQATYKPISSVPELTRSLEVTVSAPGTILAEATVNPGTIRSDRGESATVKLTLKQAGLNAGVAATVTFEVAPEDVSRVRLRTTGVGTVDANGIVSIDVTASQSTASVSVEATSDRVRGPATVIVRATGDDLENDVLERVTFVVDRLPQLQSVVFVSATPNQIGVRGSPFPSSSLVVFKLLDDLNQPMANVPVSFRTNSTADRSATVTTNAFSGGDGLVTAVLSAGTQAGPVSVVATATFQQTTLTVESLPIAITGGLPSMAHSYLTCASEFRIGRNLTGIACEAVLVDRFTDRVAQGMNVQFRAEGGNISPVGATNAAGVANATFSEGPPGRSRASVDAWSYGALVPLDASELTDVNPGDANGFRAADCFDGNSATFCNLPVMCSDPANEAYCPLPPDPVTGEVAGCANDILPFMDLLRRPQGPVAANEYFSDTALRARVDAYMADLYHCGPKTSCLFGVSDGTFLPGDECPQAPGCLDFSPETYCPQDDLMTVMASVRGEESFVDTNGNGAFDHVDTNRNGAVDPGEVAEPFIDLPEPFLDKNDNCTRDDLSGSPRLNTIEKLKLTDLFSDTNGDGKFGFSNGRQTNGIWDRDTEIFLSTHILSLTGEEHLIYGEPCDRPGEVTTCTSDPATSGECVEIAPGRGVNANCVDNRVNALRLGQQQQIQYRWVDDAGNCVGRGGMRVADSTVDAIQIAGDLAVDYTDDNCGFNFGSVNPQRPFCEELDSSKLGSPVGTMVVKGTCAFDFGTTLDIIRFASNAQTITVRDDDEEEGGATTIVTTGVIKDVIVETDCPVCGDTLVEGAEECDDGPDGSDACTSFCSRRTPPDFSKVEISLDFDDDFFSGVFNDTVGGVPHDVVVSATRRDGSRAANELVEVRVSNTTSGTTLTTATPAAPGQGGPSSVVFVRLDSEGVGHATVFPPTVARGTRSIEVTLEALYREPNRNVLRSESIGFEVYPDATAAAFAVSALPLSLQLRSDVPGERGTIQLMATQLGNVGLPGVSVLFSVASNSQQLITLQGADSLGRLQATTPANGIVSATIVPKSARARGPATVNMEIFYVDATGVQRRETRAITYTLDRPAILDNVIFVSAAPSSIGVRGSALSSSSTVTFRVVDDEGQPMGDIPLTFRKNASADPAATVTATAVTNGAGLASTVLGAGTQVGPVTIVATATQGSLTVSAESLPIAVTGGLPSFTNSFLECGNSAGKPPFTRTCSAQLADRFTNRVADQQKVQFRAEGGNITPFVNSDGAGQASALFSSGVPARSGASVLAWSYGAILPTAAGLLADVATTPFPFVAASCFDASSATPCSLARLCTDARNDAYCPLPPDEVANGTGRTCAQAIVAHTGVLNGGITAEQYFANTANARTRVDAYLADVNRCGFPLACLFGLRDGVSFIDGDECPVAPGCFDFTTATACPQDGLLTVMASFRGEEGFVDVNGNGFFDFNDANQNNRHDVGETTGPDLFIDSSEPFLDKNDNCYRDDLSGNFRLQTIDEVRHTDLFSDASLDGEFGYAGKLTNGVWDVDTELFLLDHILQIEGSPNIQVGEPCSAVNTVTTCVNNPAATGRCVEVSAGVGINFECLSRLGTAVRDGSPLHTRVRAADNNGNCPGIDFAGTLDVALGDSTDITMEPFKLDAEACGFVSTTNPERPWCEVLPALAAPAFDVDVRIDCKTDDVGPTPATFFVAVLDGGGTTTTREVQVTVQCPVCGDALLEGDEECDNGAANGTAGNACDTDCFRL